ncbi:hypothetical protein KC952_03020 [Candidatus Saccharibacteria bacterium]|jgi:hypothetical protein|nr:hypothetical protein [Candidatus Saccharibacteria bacterium]
MASSRVVDQPSPIMFNMRLTELLKVVGIGATIGLISYLIFVILDKYVFTPSLCGTSGLEQRCANKESFASSIALVIGAFGGLFALVQQRVYRPLLIVILTTLSLWNVPLIASGASSLVWVVALIVILFGLAYGAFTWLVQVRNLYLAATLGIVLLIVLRLVFSS